MNFLPEFLFFFAKLGARFLIPSSRVFFFFFFGTNEKKLIFYHHATRYCIIRGLWSPTVKFFQLRLMLIYCINLSVDWKPLQAPFPKISTLVNRFSIAVQHKWKNKNQQKIRMRWQMLGKCDKIFNSFWIINN